jgi:hypothetical protein
MVLDLGKLCSQYACVASFIISKLPCSSTDEIVCLVCLCLNENFRSAPKLSDAIILFGCIDSFTRGNIYLADFNALSRYR